MRVRMRVSPNPDPNPLARGQARGVGEEGLAEGGHLVRAPHDDPVDPLEGLLLLYGLLAE